MIDYKEPPRITKNEALKIFSTGTDDAICDALLSIVLNDSDWRWAQDHCLNFLNYPSSDIKGLAAVCLGHIARIHRQLDKIKVIAILKKHLSDPEISGRIQDALDDIEMFLN